MVMKSEVRRKERFWTTFCLSAKFMNGDFLLVNKQQIVRFCLYFLLIINANNIQKNGHLHSEATNEEKKTFNNFIMHLAERVVCF